MDFKRGLIVVPLQNKSKRGQVWVETVIYTLIAFTLIGLVLAFAVPKIQETQDKGLIEQSVGALEDIDSFVRLLGIPGNQRAFEISINKGFLTFDSVNNSLYFEIESRYAYSEPNQEIYVGNIKVFTKPVGDMYEITLTRDYSDKYNITFMKTEEIEKINKAPLPYNIVVSNQGQDANGTTIINFEVN